MGKIVELVIGALIMSVKFTDKVWSVKGVSALEKLALLVVSDQVDDDGLGVFGGLAKAISNRGLMSARQAGEMISSFKDRGFIELKQNGFFILKLTTVAK